MSHNRTLGKNAKKREKTLKELTNLVTPQKLQTSPYINTVCVLQKKHFYCIFINYLNKH